MVSEMEKAPGRMSCLHCPRYDRAGRRCLEGKANPRRKSDSIAVAETLGLRALCHYNPYREPLALRMFFPCSEFTILSTAASRNRARKSARFHRGARLFAPREAPSSEKSGSPE